MLNSAMSCVSLRRYQAMVIVSSFKSIKHNVSSQPRDRFEWPEDDQLGKKIDRLRRATRCQVGVPDGPFGGQQR